MGCNITRAFTTKTSKARKWHGVEGVAEGVGYGFGKLRNGISKAGKLTRWRTGGEGVVTTAVYRRLKVFADICNTVGIRREREGRR